VLKEDLRTATFVLRPDTESDRFRFAHTSLQEFFMAEFLHEALREGSIEDFPLPMPSNETFEFLGHLISEREIQRCLKTLEDALSVRKPGINELAFRYWLIAVQKELPEPTPTAIALGGADLDRWSIKGKDKTHPLILNRLDLRGASLRESRWENVMADQGDFSRTTAQGAEFLGIEAKGAIFKEAELSGTVFRYAILSNADFQDALLRYTHYIHCGLVKTKFPPDFDQKSNLAPTKAIKLTKKDRR
jgi:hypothetical protein